MVGGVDAVERLRIAAAQPVDEVALGGCGVRHDSRTPDLG